MNAEQAYLFRHALLRGDTPTLQSLTVEMLKACAEAGVLPFDQPAP